MNIIELIPSHHSHKGKDKEREGVCTSEHKPIASVPKALLIVNYLFCVFFSHSLMHPLSSL